MLGRVEPDAACGVAVVAVPDSILPDRPVNAVGVELAASGEPSVLGVLREFDAPASAGVVDAAVELKVPASVGIEEMTVEGPASETPLSSVAVTGDAKMLSAEVTVTIEAIAEAVGPRRREGWLDVFVMLVSDAAVLGAAQIGRAHV